MDADWPEFRCDIGRDFDEFASRAESGDVIGNLGGELTEILLGRVVGRGGGCDFILLGFVGKTEVPFPNDFALLLNMQLRSYIVRYDVRDNWSLRVGGDLEALYTGGGVVRSVIGGVIGGVLGVVNLCDDGS